jgi:ATP-dependent DNA helicase RecG
MSEMESQLTEWKESWRDEYLKWLCGFANAEGGVLVIGRSDRGQAVGVSDAKKLLVDLPNKIRDVLGIVADVRLVREDGKDLVEIRVEPYPNPISYKGEYHVRSGSTKQELKGAALDRFLMRRYGRTWDSAPVPGVTVRQLSATAFKVFRDLAKQSDRVNETDLRGSREKLLEKLRLVDGKYLTRAAVLLFHPDPEQYFSGAHIKTGYFENEGDVLYHDLIEGDLLAQAAKTVEMIRAKYMKAAITYEGIHRIETYPVPYDALREAILNAVIHKDYSSTSPIQIKVYEDRMTIWNPGPLPEGWTNEKLMQPHPSEPSNPRIANAFFRCGEIESWGRGIWRIFNACKQVGFPAPKIEQEGSGWWTTFTYPKAVLERLSGQRAESGEPKTRVKSTGKTLVETPVKTPVKILAILKDHPEYSLADVAAAIGKSISAVERAAAKLVKSGKLRRVGPAKGGHWEILE